MKRQSDRDVVRAFQRLTKAADEFVNRAPRVKRIQAERSALLDAITDAQLVLSVHRLPKDTEQEQQPATRSKRTLLLEEQMRKSQATLKELERRLRPLTVELEGLHTKTQRAKALLDPALATLELQIERRSAA
jgi:hypothetical protein